MANRILKGMNEKLESEIKVQIVVKIVEEYELDIARACKLIAIHCSYCYYEEKRNDSEVDK